ncbi:MAG: hypothetical protein ACYS1C_12690 [Planctomycetota bacterium]|jgi:hypothetical protein
MGKWRGPLADWPIISLIELAIVVLMALVLALTLFGQALDWFFIERPLEKRYEEVARRGAFMRSVFDQVHVGYRGASGDLHELDNAIQEAITRKGNPFKREYVVAEVDGRIYVAELPEAGDWAVWLVSREGGAQWARIDKEPMLQVLRRGRRGTSNGSP